MAKKEEQLFREHCPSHGETIERINNLEKTVYQGNSHPSLVSLMSSIIENQNSFSKEFTGFKDAICLDMKEVKENINGLSKNVGGLMRYQAFMEGREDEAEKIKRKMYDNELSHKKDVERMRVLNRWMIGITVTIFIGMLSLIIHLITKDYEKIRRIEETKDPKGMEEVSPDRNIGGRDRTAFFIDYLRGGTECDSPGE